MNDSHPDTEPVTLADAAEELDVHYMTAYRYVRTGRMVAEKRGGKWWVTAADLAAVVAEGTGARRSPSGSSAEPRQLMAGPFTDRLVAGDTAGCWDMISDALSAGASPVEIHHRLFQVALEQVGDAWERGDLSVSDEHRATSTASRLLGQLGPLFRRRGRRRGTVVVGAFDGDPHALPSALLADLLSDRRFDVIDLGANTPAMSFVDAAQRCDDLVGIGVCGLLDDLIPTALVQARELRQALPDVFLVLGGPAIVKSGRAEFAELADVISVDGLHACDVFDEAASAAAATSQGEHGA